MASIAQDLQQIRQAVYGEEVREAIADGLENCYHIHDVADEKEYIQNAINEFESHKDQVAAAMASMAQLGTDTTLSTPGVAADAAAVGDLKSALKPVGLDPIEETENVNAGAFYFIGTNNSLDLTQPPSTEGASNFSCFYIPCEQGDTFVVTSRAASAARPVAFLSSMSGENNIIQRINGDNYNCTNTKIIAPCGTKYAVFNYMHTAKHMILKGPLHAFFGENNEIAEREYANKHGNNIICVDKFVDNEYYGTTSGDISNADTYCRSANVFEVTSKRGLILCDRTIQYENIYAIFFDSNMQFVATKRLDASAKYTLSRVPIVPVNAKYCGLTILKGSYGLPTKIEIQYVDGSGIICVDQNAKDTDEGILAVLPNNVMYPSGELSPQTNDFMCVMIPYPKCKKIFQSNNIANQAVCYLTDGSIVMPQYDEQISLTGRTYTIPENTAILCINLYKVESYATFIYSQIDGNSSFSTDVIQPRSRIAGKRIAAIGDSITYLDGMSGYSGQRASIGWQAYLRMCGAFVQSFAFDGRPYTKNSDGTCIADEVVDGQIDLSGYDIVILFGGSNDERLSTPIGNPNTDFANPDINSATFIGAIGKLINYARSQNPNVEIYLCTITPSRDLSRAFTVWVQYNEAIKRCAEFWSVPFIETGKMIGAVPGANNFSDFYYDTTHPNNKGMRRLGKGIASYINNYYSVFG